MNSLALYWLQFPFAEVTLHYAEFSGNKNSSHQSRTCLLTYFWWSSETMRFLCASFVSWLCDYPPPPIFRDSLHPRAITTFCEMHSFKRNFHAELQELNAAFLSKEPFLGAWWISLSPQMGKGGDNFFSSPTMGWKCPHIIVPFKPIPWCLSMDEFYPVGLPLSSAVAHLVT